MAEPQGIHRRISFEVTPALESRFWRRVSKGSAAECWLWIGAHRNGYGAIKHAGRVLSTHVVSYVLHRGEIPQGHIVTHDCDNRICCNPDHLKLGTFQSNAAEMHERRKIAAPRGVELPNAVLNDELVREIRRRFVPRKVGYRRIAEQLGLRERTVKNVLEGKTWTHVI